ncbi:MAG: hypothetical protein M3258_08850 [Thermoproteota archaeon]|nr:hypothetical protein [Thermoproteota archaeon]
METAGRDFKFQLVKSFHSVKIMCDIGIFIVIASHRLASKKMEKVMDELIYLS